MLELTIDPGELPTDGLHSLERVGFAGSNFVVGVNPPINFAGDTDSVSIPAVPTGMPLVVLVGLVGLVGLGVSLTASALYAMRRRG